MCDFVLSPSPADARRIAARLALDADGAFACHRGFSAYAATPLVRLPGLARELGLAELWVKDESARFGLNSFKALGAAYAMHRALAERSGRFTICTATDGNHGRAVAWSAQILGHEAAVYVPVGTTPPRIAAIEAEGARVEVVAGDYDQAVRVAAETTRERGWLLIQDTAWKGYEEVPRWIMAGYTTVLRELEETLFPPDAPAVDCVFLQAGVGSWAAAAAWWLAMRYGARCPRIICVEPRAAAGLLESARAGRIVSSRGAGGTIMDGLSCATPSTLAWPILRATVDAFLAIPDDLSAEAVRRWRHPSAGDPPILAGPSGAAGFAGILAVLHDADLAPVRAELALGRSSRVLTVNTEGPLEPRQRSTVMPP